MTVADTILRTDVIEVDKNDLQPGDRRFWSVTTIIDAVSKGEGLMIWASRLAAAEAIAADPHGLAAARCWYGDGEVANYFAGARNRARAGLMKDADLGSVFHMCAENWVLTEQRPDREMIEQFVYAVGGPNLPLPVVVREIDLIDTFLDNFARWLDRFQPTYEAAEFVVYSPTYGYAGTCDGIMRIAAGPDNDAMRLTCDYKTTRNAYTARGKPKTPYVETVLQLAAYRHAEFAAGTVARRYSYYSRRYYLLSAAEQELAIPVPETDGAVCVLVTPESCDAYPMRADAEAYRAFLYCLEVARWQFQTSKGAVGAPLTVPGRD